MSIKKRLKISYQKNFAAVNSWVFHKELYRKLKMAFLDFLCELSENLIAKGQGDNLVKRSSRSGRRSKQVNECGGTPSCKRKNMQKMRRMSTKRSREENKDFMQKLLSSILQRLLCYLS